MIMISDATSNNDVGTLHFLLIMINKTLNIFSRHYIIYNKIVNNDDEAEYRPWRWWKFVKYGYRKIHK